MSYTKQNLADLKKFAHGAFGYLLDDNVLRDIWLLSHPTLEPIIRREWPLPSVMRSIAHGWLEVEAARAGR